jgi:hypothetical protein
MDHTTQSLRANYFKPAEKVVVLAHAAKAKGVGNFRSFLALTSSRGYWSVSRTGRLPLGEDPPAFIE